jgi:hypothetical protein
MIRWFIAVLFLCAGALAQSTGSGQYSFGNLAGGGGGGWPDESNTGYTGTLSPCSGTINTPGTYTNCEFSGDVTLTNGVGMTSGTSVTISNCLIPGVITQDEGFGAEFYRPYVYVNDCVIGTAVVGQSIQHNVVGIRFERIEAFANIGAYAWWLKDSYLHDFCGFEDTDPGPGVDPSHYETFVASGANSFYTVDGQNYGTVAWHNTLVASLKDDPGCYGAWSAVFVIYSHGEIWNPGDNHLSKNNYFSMPVTNKPHFANVCAYLGQSTSYSPTNIDIIDNVFDLNMQDDGTCGNGTSSLVVVGWNVSAGNTWSGNKWSDETSIPEPGDSTY